MLRASPRVETARQRPCAARPALRAAARSAVLVVAVGAYLTVTGLPASAHDPIEEALGRGEGPPDWIYPVGAALAVLVSLSAVAIRTAQSLDLIERPRLRHWALVTHLLTAWVFLGLTQNMVARTGQATAALVVAGYLLLPTVLLAVWVVVLVNYRGLLRRVFLRSRHRWTAAVVAGSYAVLAGWSSNMVAVPEEHDMPPPNTPAFVDLGWFHGPLAPWPALEFWLPGPNIFGALSLGAVAVIATVAVLMGLAWAAAVHAVGLRRARGARGRAGAGRLTGMAFTGTAGMNVCCCCAPAVFPVLALVFGPAAGASIATWFLGASSPLYDLGLVAMIAMAMFSLASLERLIGPSGGTLASPAGPLDTEGSLVTTVG
jgi:hypothetical protein